MNCCVPGCAVRYSDGVPLHRFPNSDKEIERFRDWVSKVGGEILGLTNSYITKNRRVCHRHFEKKFHYPRNRLCRIAIPTLHLSTPYLPGHVTGSARPLPMDVDRPAHSTMPDVSPMQTQNQSDSTSSTSAVPMTVHEDVPVKHPIQTQTPCSKMSKDEMEMSRSITILQKKMKYQKKYFKKRLFMAKKLMKSGSLDILTKKMSKPAKSFVKMQVTQAGKRSRGRRFTLNQKILALSLYKSSPKAYRVLSQICILPKRKTLQCLLQRLEINTGINETMFKHLLKRVKKMPEHHKYCAIIFDEMAISPHLDLTRGKITGFVDNGVERKPIIADHALVFMVRGVIKKFKQPVHYSFCAGTTKTHNLKFILKSVIEEVQACGLKVVATVCDQGATNMAAINLLKKETQAVYLRQGKENNDGESCFEIGGTKIFPLYDPPHLIKGVRNNLLNKSLIYEKNNKKCVAKWEHIIDLYVRGPGYRGVRLVPKLTEHHVMPHLIPKMRVKHSTQVFSQTVGVALGFMADSGKLPTSAKETADMLLFFDDLFDSVNGSYSKVQGGKVYRSAVTPTSRHHQLWRDSIPVLKSMRYVNKDGKAVVVPSLSSWIKTIEGFQLLCRHLFKKGQTSLLLRHFNQDPIENLFGAIRAHGHSNIMPTAASFEAAYKTLLVNNMSSAHSVGANCEKDEGRCLKNLKSLFAEKQIIKKKEHVIISDDLEITNEHNILTSNLPQDVERCAAVGYCSGWLVRNVKKKIYKGCTICKSQLESMEKQPFHKFIKISEYCNKDWLCYPTIEAFNMFLDIENIVMEILRTRSHDEDILDYIKLIVDVNCNFNFLTCNVHKNFIIEYCVEKNVYFCINNWCKEINKILCGKSRNTDETDPIKTAAQTHFLITKSKKRKRATGLPVRV